MSTQQLPSPPEYEKGNYICLYCTCTVDSLIKKFPKGEYELFICPQCGNNVDMYIEFEENLKIFHLVLAKVSLFRHLIFNTNHPHSFILTFNILLILIISQCASINPKSLDDLLSWNYMSTLFLMGKILIEQISLISITGILIRSFVNNSKLGILRIFHFLIISQVPSFAYLFCYIWNFNDFLRSLLFPYLVYSEFSVVYSKINRLITQKTCTLPKFNDYVSWNIC